MNTEQIKAAPNCDDDYDAASLSCDEALAAILDYVEPISDVETVPVREALDRTLARAIVSAIDVPSHANSAMDGYAVRAQDLPSQGLSRLHVVGTAFAGKPYDGAVARGCAVRIMTGAVVPAEASVVIMQEQVEVEANDIVIDNRHKDGQNVRAAGEDIKRGSSVLEPGRILNPADLGLIASLGIGEATVFRRPRVAFLSTGDELNNSVVNSVKYVVFQIRLIINFYFI
jgi:molybdopterin molybdotransferase